MKTSQTILVVVNDFFELGSVFQVVSDKTYRKCIFQSIFSIIANLSFCKKMVTS